MMHGPINIRATFNVQIVMYALVAKLRWIALNRLYWDLALALRDKFSEPLNFGLCQSNVIPPACKVYSD